MALIYCPECDGVISDKSMFCVHCGCPANYYDLKHVVYGKQQPNLDKKEKVSVKPQNKQPIPDMRTIAEASDATGLSYHAVRQMVIRGEIVSVALGNKRLVNMDSLIAYLNGEKA